MKPLYKPKGYFWQLKSYHFFCVNYFLHLYYVRFHFDTLTFWTFMISTILLIFIHLSCKCSDLIFKIRIFFFLLIAFSFPLLYNYLSCEVVHYLSWSSKLILKFFGMFCNTFLTFWVAILASNFLIAPHFIDAKFYRSDALVWASTILVSWFGHVSLPFWLLFLVFSDLMTEK